MPRRLLIPLLLVLGLLAPATAAAAKPPVGVVAKPTVTWVHLARIAPATGQTSPLADRVIARVLVHHGALRDAAVGAQSIGTITIVLSRFQGDRDYSIAGGTAARALPVTGRGIDVVYQVVLNGRQSTAVQQASTAGVLRALVLVDQRAKARGHAPARDGNFLQTDAKVLTAGLPVPVATPPYLSGNGRRVVIEADRQGRGIVDTVELPISGGRTLRLDTGGTAGHGLVLPSGAPSALSGTVTILGADGATLATLAAPAGFTLAVSPTGRERGTLVWPGLDVPGTDPVVAGSALLAPPPTR